MARPKLVRHDDLLHVWMCDAWERMVAYLSELLNEYARDHDEPLTNERATRAVLFALQIAGLADECDDCETMTWPYAVEENGTGQYSCQCGRTWTCSYDPSRINRLPSKGLPF